MAFEGNSLLDEMTHGVRTWGNDPHGDTVFLVGAYGHLSDISDRLLGVLPPVLTMPRLPPASAHRGPPLPGAFTIGSASRP